jgi:hypothetical protein
VKRHMETVFGIKLEMITLAELAEQMNLDLSFKKRTDW